MVTQRHIRMVCSSLKVVRAVLLLALPGSIALLWMTTPRPPVLANVNADAPSEDAPQPKTTRDLAWYAPLWERDLKQPPVPSVVADPEPESRREPGPVPTLLATLVESQARYAHLIGRSGKVQLKGIDETIDQFRVQAIEPGRVQLQDGSGVLWIEIPKREGQRR